MCEGVAKMRIGTDVFRVYHLTYSLFPNDDGCGNALRLTVQGDLAISFDAHVAWLNNPAWRYYNADPKHVISFDCIPP